ncbi:AAA family ATPase [Patescibacteria group bacterium]|nr:AAA family ATPase [Patescibacteria group bacterium]MBU1246503.1 AAA family ATPase [Patescibacteria group bacterium]MBU1519320.1 AAA family ATPase [Patescibacteria group bacterium]MBU1729962.1 AAA family ATPase [Patescibacteria group bacterium]MBU1956431.1 AAA family ATPase [Patescibacteria group bacterium]
MRLKSLEIVGFKSFSKKTALEFGVAISAVVGPNGSGKSNIAEAVRFVLGEQSFKSMRGKRGEDFIFSGSQNTGRRNQAKITITFDNTDRAFNLDFDEVILSREVFRDSSNQYCINNSQVRLKDIIELLSSVHIGASSHHIISQGEADRILSVSPKERKEMIEDALGLKIYHWKINESEKKLIKTSENLKEVELLRREIAPHLKYLKKQIEKIERTRSLRDELAKLYKEYLQRENIYLQLNKTRVSRDTQLLQKEAEQLKEELSTLNTVAPRAVSENALLDEASVFQKQLYTTREKKNELLREIGKIEGMMEYEKREREKNQENKNSNTDTDLRVEIYEVEKFIKNLEKIIQVPDSAPYEDLKLVLEKIRNSITIFYQTHKGEKDQEPDKDQTAPSIDLQKEYHILQQAFADIIEQEKQLIEKNQTTQLVIEKNKNEARDTERILYEKKAQLSIVETKIETLQNEEVRYHEEAEEFETEIREGLVIVGSQIKEFHQYVIDEQAVLMEDRKEQENRRRQISVLKIRIENLSGGVGEETLKEYDDTKERDEFLAKEITDLEMSAQSLQKIITDLQKQLNEDFTSGITNINKQFQNFFSLMFGGGQASLFVTTDTKNKKSKNGQENEFLKELDTEDEDKKTGIDVSVSLPLKKIKGLVALSGGERALTSIALLFALSQVNPPPFMILDETDAALDEANSRKYGDMLENLSKFSQLIVITHNRETMSRAGILYGVTMDASASSTLLSVKFEEAEKIVK